MKVVRTSCLWLCPALTCSQMYRVDDEETLNWIFTCACITVFCSFSSLTWSFHSAACVSNCSYTHTQRQRERMTTPLYLLFHLQLLFLHCEAFLCFVNCFFKQLATKTSKTLPWDMSLFSTHPHTISQKSVSSARKYK